MSDIIHTSKPRVKNEKEKGLLVLSALSKATLCYSILIYKEIYIFLHYWLAKQLIRQKKHVNPLISFFPLTMVSQHTEIMMI